MDTSWTCQGLGKGKAEGGHGRCFVARHRKSITGALVG